jgi:hypothetical protein
MVRPVTLPLVVDVARYGASAFVLAGGEEAGAGAAPSALGWTLEDGLDAQTLRGGFKGPRSSPLNLRNPEEL